MKRLTFAFLLVLSLLGCQKISKKEPASGGIDAAEYLRLVGLKQIPKVLEITSKLDGDKVEITSVKRVESLTPLVEETRIAPAKLTLLALDAKGERVTSRPLFFSSVLLCEGDAKVKTNETVTTILDDGVIHTLAIIDETGATRATFAAAKAATSDEKVSFLAVLDPKELASEGGRMAAGPDGVSKFYHVVILGHNYPDPSVFRARANGAIEHLFTYPVFQKLRGRIQFFIETRSGDLGCRHPLEDPNHPDPRMRWPKRVVFCEKSLVTERANAAGPYDHIAVLSYDREYGGAAHADLFGTPTGTPKGSYFTTSTEHDPRLGDFRQIFAHEFGHVLGLHDEYDYDYTPTNWGPNCAPTLPAIHQGWAGYAPKQGCSDKNWFRPDDSVMYTLQSNHFNRPSEMQIENVIRRISPGAETFEGFMNWTDVAGGWVGRGPMGQAAFPLQNTRTLRICLDCERKVEGTPNGPVSASIITTFENGIQANPSIVSSTTGLAGVCANVGPSDTSSISELKCIADGQPTKYARITNQRVIVAPSTTPTPTPAPPPTINLTGTMKWIIDFQNSSPNFESSPMSLGNAAFSVYHGYKIKICLECRKSVNGVQQGTVYADGSTRFVPIGNVATWARQTGNGKATLCTDSIHSASRHLTTLTCSTPEGQTQSGVVDNVRD